MLSVLELQWGYIHPCPFLFVKKAVWNHRMAKLGQIWRMTLWISLRKLMHFPSFEFFFFFFKKYLLSNLSFLCRSESVIVRILWRTRIDNWFTPINDCILSSCWHVPGVNWRISVFVKALICIYNVRVKFSMMNYFLFTLPRSEGLVISLDEPI